jgi:hypothetical protein
MLNTKPWENPAMAKRLTSVVWTALGLTVLGFGLAAPLRATDPTETPTPVPALVEDFEHQGTQSQDNWGFPVDMVADGNSSIVAQPASATAWSDSSGDTHDAGFCAHLSGTLNGSPGSAYAYFAVELDGRGFTEDADLTPFSGLQFDFKAGAPGVQYSASLVTSAITDTAYYQFQFSPADTAWHSYQVAFPPAVPSPDGFLANQFSQPDGGWVMAVPFAKKAGAIKFGPVVQTSAVDFDMSIDNIRFVTGTAQAVPAVDADASHLIDSCENREAEGVLEPKGPYAGDISINAGGTGIATTPSAGLWPVKAYSAPGCPKDVDPLSKSLGHKACKEFTGTVPSSDGCWANVQWSLVKGGYGYNSLTAGVDMSAGKGPHNRLVFDARSSSADPSLYFGVQLCTASTGYGRGVKAAYNFLTSNFKPGPDWKRFVVYLPGQPYKPQFGVAYTTPAFPKVFQWADDGVSNDVQAVVVLAGNSSAAPVQFELQIDNLRFD